MTLKKTSDTVLNDEQILAYIAEYEDDEVGEFTKLWHYYKGKNDTILDREIPDANSPDNRTPVPYGRKIVTTFTGYAFRPRYITYKARETSGDAYMQRLQENFDLNNEHILTSRAGRNTGIFGLSYELLYIDEQSNPRYITVDPREIILLYDYQPDPKPVICIRFYEITENLYKVEVYYKESIMLYERYRDKSGQKWLIRETGMEPNYFMDIPIVAYYAGDDMLGVIEPVIPLIDDYDLLISDSFNEFDRFAQAYLLLKKLSLVDPVKTKTPTVYDRALAFLKRLRIIELPQDDSDARFLTKDIPDGFINFISDLVREQIHVQSHVPDFTGERMAGASGIAIQRLLFDFENMVSSSEADFDKALYERIRLITAVMDKSGGALGVPSDITISHKRNIPLDLAAFADVALKLKQADFSQRLVLDIMPDDIVPDVQAELDEEKKEQAAMFPDVTQITPAVP